MNNDLQFIFAHYNLRPEFIASLLEQGIEMERIMCQAHESLKSEKQHESMVRLLQGERFLSVLSIALLT